MSKTAWVSVVIIFAIIISNMTLALFINQEPVVNFFKIEKLEYFSESGNFTMTNVILEIPSRSLDWLPLAGITLKQNSY